MARYTDIDALIEKVEETDWYHISEQGELVRGANSKYNTPLYKHSDIVGVLNNAPTADVVPKSELDDLQAMLDATIAGQETLQKALAEEKSEVERLTRILNSYALQYGTATDQQKVIDQAKSEVARKICCEIEEEIVAALESNYKAKAERMAKPHIEMADEFISYCDGKILALRGIEVFVEEIKKKYTRQCPGCKHFVGCECFDGKTCDEYEGGDE